MGLSGVTLRSGSIFSSLSNPSIPASTSHRGHPTGATNFDQQVCPGGLTRMREPWDFPGSVVSFEDGFQMAVKKILCDVLADDLFICSERFGKSLAYPSRNLKTNVQKLSEVGIIIRRRLHVAQRIS